MYAWAPRMEPIDQLSNCELETKKGVRMCGSCAQPRRKVRCMSDHTNVTVACKTGDERAGARSTTAFWAHGVVREEAHPLQIRRLAHDALVVDRRRGVLHPKRVCSIHALHVSKTPGVTESRKDLLRICEMIRATKTKQVRDVSAAYRPSGLGRRRRR